MEHKNHTTTIGTIETTTVTGTIGTVIDCDSGQVTENAVAAVIIFAVGLLGLTFNILAIIFIRRLPQMRNPYGILTAAHCAAAVLVLAIFTVWAAPLTAFEACSIAYWPGVYFGYLCNYGWYAAIFCSHGIAVNRFTAIALPVTYRKWFTNEKAIGIVVILWLLTLLEEVWYFFGCDTYFDPVSYGWTYTYNDCRKKLDMYENAIIDSIIIGMLFVIDAATFTRIRQFSKMKASANKEVQQKMKQELRFFIQAFLSDISLLVSQLAFCFLSPVLAKYYGKWPNFFANTILWEGHHMVDGAIIVFVNPEMRHLLFHWSELYATMMGRSKPIRKTTTVTQLSSKVTASTLL